MTTANKITILRMLLIPVFVAELLYYGRTGLEGHRLGALLAFITAAICDGVDGYIARRYNQQSELGALLDPIADKLLLVSGLVVLSFNHRPFLPELPLWLVITVLSRDVLLLGGMMVVCQTVGRFTPRPRMVGKVAAVGQMVCVAWALLKWNEWMLWYGALVTAIGTGVAGLLYLRDWMRLMSASPASGPAPKP